MSFSMTSSIFTQKGFCPGNSITRIELICDGKERSTIISKWQFNLSKELRKGKLKKCGFMLTMCWFSVYGSKKRYHIVSCKTV